MKSLWTFLAISAVSIPLYTMGNPAEARIIYSTEEGGTPTESFVIDSEDYATDVVTLQFGTDSTAFFRFDKTKGQFEIGGDLDFNGYSARNMKLHSGTTAERLAVDTPAEGTIFWDTTLDAVYIADGNNNLDGSHWILIGGLTGADAATLDGLESTQFVRSDANTTTSNNSTFTVGAGSSLVGAAGSTINLDAANVSINGVNNNTFTLDEDNTGGNVTLQFGAALGETIGWNAADGRFEMSDDLLVQGSIAQNGNTFTLDAENTGAGANVDIIAHQGSDANGTLRYDAADNVWKISNNGGGFSEVVGTNLNQTLTNKTIDASLNTITNLTHASIAERPKTDTLAPEYANMTLTELNGNNASSGNHKGTLSGDRDVTGGHYYSWESKKTDLNDYTIAVAWAVPSDFKSWQASPLTVRYKTEVANTADNAVDIIVRDAAGNLLGSATGLANTAWTDQNISLSSAPTPGEVLTVHMTLKSRRPGGSSAADPVYARIGNITFKYNAQ